MTQLAATTFQPGAARITSIGRNPLGGNFQEVLRIKGADLPGNGDYQFIVFGRIGDVVFDSTEPFLFADLMLGNAAGGFFTTARHCLALQDLLLRRVGTAADPQRAFPFLLMHKAAGWTTADDLVLYARIYDERIFPDGNPSYACAQLGILAFNLTAVGAANHLAEESVLGSTTLPYDPTYATLHTTAVLPWTAGSEDWVIWWNARVRAGHDALPYGCYIDAWDGSTVWEWGQGPSAIDGPYGGATRRGGLTPTAVDVAGYSLGAVLQQPITTIATSLRLRARCRYTAGTQAVARQTRVFGLRLSRVHEWHSTKTVLAVAYYGSDEGTGGVIDDKVHDVSHQDAVWLACAVPVPPDQARAYHTRLKHNEVREINYPSNLQVVQQHAPLEGLYELAGGKLDVHDGNNFYDHETVRPPSESQHLLHYVGNITGGSPPGVFQVGETLLGLTSGATVKNREIRQNPAPKNVRFWPGSRVGTFLPGEVIQGQGSGAQATLRTTPPPLEEPGYHDARYRAFVVFDPFDVPPPTPINEESAGLPVVYVPGREGPSLGSLPTLPVAPSAPLQVELVHGRVQLRSPYGYVDSWPRFATPRRRATFQFRALSRGLRDAILTWIHLQGIGAFRFTDQDDVERAYVIDVDSVRSSDVGVQQTLEFSAFELRWLA